MPLASRLTVDLDAIAANYRTLRDLVAPAECSAVVKADGYGLGAALIAKRLAKEGCQTFWVAHLSEALEVKEALRDHKADLFVLNGLGDEEISDFARHAIKPVLNTIEEARRWSTEAPKAPAAVHLDTGINRLGLSTSDDDSLRELIESGLNVAHWMSHLACADEPGRSENSQQMQRFKKRLSRLPNAPASLANSAGCFLGADYHFDLTRPGLALYGAQPVQGQTQKLAIPYRFEAPVLQVRAFKAGDAFGYGGTSIATKAGFAATIGAGYADGVPRALSNNGHVWVNGIKAPILGRVSMDSTIVDISALSAPESLTGQLAEIYGPHLSVDAQAASAGLSAYELLTRIGGRTQRRHVNELAES